MVRQTACRRDRARRAGGHPRHPTTQLTCVHAGARAFVRSPVFSTIYRLVLGELHQFPDLAKFYADEVVARGQKLIGGIIRRGIDAGEFREIDPMVAARMLVALIVMNGIWRDEHTGVRSSHTRVTRRFSTSWPSSISIRSPLPDGAFPRQMARPWMLFRSSHSSMTEFFSQGHGSLPLSPQSPSTAAIASAPAYAQQNAKRF